MEVDMLTTTFFLAYVFLYFEKHSLYIIIWCFFVGWGKVSEKKRL